MRNVGLVGLAVVVAATASCGDVVRSSRAPVMLLVNSLTSVGGNTLNVTPPKDAMGTATLAVIMKDVSVSAPAATTNNDVRIHQYHVEYRRADGHNTSGVDVPYPFDGVATALITAGDAKGTDMPFELVRLIAMKESPLVQIGTNPNTVSISTIADVTFFGTDSVGNDVSATGSMLINFGNGK